MKKFLIVLNDRKDVTYRLVNPVAMGWIGSPHNIPPGKTSTMEKIPQALIDDSDDCEHEIYVSTGSWENDRAIGCPNPRGMVFSNIVAMQKYVTEHNIELVAEYHGVCY